MSAVGNWHGVKLHKESVYSSITPTLHVSCLHLPVGQRRNSASLGKNLDLISPTSLSCPPQPHPMFAAQGVTRLPSKVTFLHVSPCGRSQGVPGSLWGQETGLQRRQQRRPRLPINSSSRFASFFWASGLRGNLGRREEPLGRPQLRVSPGEVEAGRAPLLGFGPPTAAGLACPPAALSWNAVLHTHLQRFTPLPVMFAPTYGAPPTCGVSLPLRCSPLVTALPCCFSRV